jgi:hypothetical protein
MTSTVVTTLVGLIVGGLITFFVARYYYVRASEDLLAESRRLRNIVNLLAGGLINAGLFEGKFDPETEDLSRITISSKIIPFAGKRKQTSNHPKMTQRQCRTTRPVR